jgi:pyruvate formate lyase activating enzyme
LDSLQRIRQLGIWLEVTTLVIPGINDDQAELHDVAGFIAEELGVETPWHISGFVPRYKMDDAQPTHVATLQLAQEIGLEAGLRYVYLGNVPGEANTSCYNCGRLLIRRSSGFGILENHVGPEGKCPDCDTPVPGVGMQGKGRK